MAQAYSQRRDERQVKEQAKAGHDSNHRQDLPDVTAGND